MIKFLNKFKYKTLYIAPIFMFWNDLGVRSVASIIFQENGFGKRRLIKEGSLGPMDHDQHQYWHNVAVPWREKTLVFEGENKPVPVARKDNVIYLERP